MYNKIIEVYIDSGFRQIIQNSNVWFKIALVLFLGRIECPNGCGRSYKYNTDLNRHLQYECGISPKYACPHCPKRSALKSNLKRHIILVHSLLTSPVLIK